MSSAAECQASGESLKDVPSDHATWPSWATGVVLLFEW
jgi:hypothetical protein